MSRSVAADRDFSALDESRSTNKAAVLLGDRSAPPRAETATTRAQDSLNETRTRAYDALDLNRNYRQISILLIHRSIKLLEESQLLLKQSSELRSMIWASSRQAVEASFALLSRGRKQDSNEP